MMTNVKDSVEDLHPRTWLRGKARADGTDTAPNRVTRPRRAPPGAVRLREELGTHVGRPDQVPDECKEKRGESGQVASW